ncbi:MAG: zinc-dependent alcohol dehydrogenase family protein [Planctomycetota bacterium]
MKAAVLEAVGKLAVKEVPTPKPKADELLVKVAACGVCGTDVKLFHGDYQAQYPVILGHEFAGEVAAVGPDVASFKVGDLVTSDPNESCGKCDWCRAGQSVSCGSLAGYGVFCDGAFAEYIRIREASAYRLPEDLPLETACFVEPVACAVHGADCAQYRCGDAAVIVGAGPMGQLHIQLAAASPIRKLIVVEPNADRATIARKAGADVVIDPTACDAVQAVKDETGGLGAEVVVDVVGIPKVLEASLRMVKNWGRVVIFGLHPQSATVSVSPFDLLTRHITVIGAWVNPYTTRRAIHCLASGKVKVDYMVTTRLPIDRALEGINLTDKRPPGFLKALIVPGK